MSEATPSKHDPETDEETPTNVAHEQNKPTGDVNLQPFLIADPPATVGGHLNDTKAVRDCLNAAVDYFHHQLPDHVRQTITDKWGITGETIDEKRIGYTGTDDGVVEYLCDHGFDGLTIVRSGLVGTGGFRHVFECKPAQDRRPTAFSCSHDFSPALDTLSIKRHENEINTAAIDLTTVLDNALASGDRLRNWWDNRIVFPYRNEQGVVTYFIGRATEDTNDIGYNDGTTAKYLKQTVNKPWVNTEAVREPMFGCETVTENKQLIITEGVTDAIMAHQFDFNCITPATTEFKHQHHKRLREYAEQASTVYIINDNDRSNVGLQKALTTAATLFDTDVEVNIALLPRGPNKENVDLADYLAAHGRDGLETILNRAIQPFDQDELFIKPDGWESSRTTQVESSSEKSGSSTSSSSTGRGSPNGGGDSSRGLEASTKHDEHHEPDDHERRTVVGDGEASAIYDLTLGEVIDDQAVGINRSSANKSLYRGDNPIDHTGEDHSGYFAIYQESVRDPDTGDTTMELRARDFKMDFSYNALTWMACASGVRSTDAPEGSLSNEEVWSVWKHAKTQDHIDIPSDDPIPLRAMWHLAKAHDLVPEEFIPESFDDPMRLPPSVYNRILETVVREHGVNHGRKDK